MSPVDGVVLVIGCGTRAYREYLLSSAAARHPLWLFVASEPSWQRQYVQGATVVDLTDQDAVLLAARDLASTTPVRGVLSWDEAVAVTTARVADELGLPGAGIDGIEGCKDKPRGRRALMAAGIDQPRFDFVRDEAAAVAAAARIGYPVVVKPRAAGASIAVVLAGDAAAVRRAFGGAEAASRNGAPEYVGGAVVEEYLPGPEISIDGATVDGRYTPMFVAHKTVGMAPYFEEVSHVVDPADELLADPRLTEMLAAAHTAIGFHYGITHSEVKLTDRGPVIVEINGRLGGDLIPLVGRYATGIDPGAVAVEVALGVQPHLARPRPGPSHPSRWVGVRFGYPSVDSVVESVSMPDPRPEDGLLQAAALAEPGARLRLPPAEFIARHAYVICAGPDRESCEAALDRALARVRLTARPLAAPDSLGPPTSAEDGRAEYAEP